MYGNTGLKSCRSNITARFLFPLVVSLFGHLLIVGLLKLSGLSNVSHFSFSDSRTMIHVVRVNPSVQKHENSNAYPLRPKKSTHKLLITEETSVTAKTSANGNQRFELIKEVDSYYFKTSELTRKPVVIQDIPDHTSIVFPGEIPETIQMELLINEEGDVDQVLIEGNLIPEAIKEKLTKIFSTTKFIPGIINDMHVKTHLKIELRFPPVLSF